MTGIMAALKAYNHIGAFRKPVDNLALAFIAPLRTDHYYVRHFSIPASCARRRALLKPAHL
jgi:hypothetical protein